MRSTIIQLVAASGAIVACNAVLGLEEREREVHGAGSGGDAGTSSGGVSTAGGGLAGGTNQGGTAGDATGGDGPDAGGEGGTTAGRGGSAGSVAGGGGVGGSVGMVCKPETTFCEDGSVKRCADDGLSSTVQATCVNQTCLEASGAARCQGDCARMQKQCTGNAVRSCDESGQYSAPVPCPATAPSCASGACTQPPSCQGLAPTCGSGANDSCCSSPLVPEGTFNRINDSSYPATVSDFRLDKYEVTVGRFRKFKTAWDGGWRPAPGAGKHAHLNAGNGLRNTGGSGYEPGWDTSWVPNVDTSDAARGTMIATWTSNEGSQEMRPINFVNWYEAFAFCIWDGGFLSSEAEWNYAAAGGGDSEGQRQYPWSSPPSSRTIDCTYATYYGANDETTFCFGTYTTNVGYHSPKGDGRYHQSDLAGNVWEWNLDWYVDPPATAFTGSCNDCTYPSGTSRSIRGAPFSAFGYLLLTSQRSYSAPGNRLYDIGIRCARSP